MILENSVLGLIERQAAVHGDRIAVITPSARKTYEDIRLASDALAAYLDHRLKEYKGPLMVYGHKDPQMLVSFLACAKSGRAYCPVDISMPKSRVREIAEAIGCPLVLSAAGAAPATVDDAGTDIGSAGNGRLDLGSADAGLGLAGIEVVDAERAAAEFYGQHYTAKAPVTGEDTFYIIFTSGSSGRPKGVEVSENNLREYLAWSRKLIAEKTRASAGRGRGEVATRTSGASEVATRTSGAGEGLTFLNQAPFSFDLSVMDLYNSLTTGGTLLCLEKKLQEDMGAAFEYMRRGRPNVWVSTPSFADMCLADRSFSGEMLAELRLFLFCGERLSKDTAGRLMERFSAAKIVNTYGPTECTVCVTQTEITPQMLGAADSLPVGAPKEGCEILFDGEEMIITGGTVAKGYFRDEEKTKKAFITVRDGAGRAVRGYRTGDSGYFKDGQYYCTGRIDKQVKLHGYRIELGDIENNLEALPQVAQAVCVPCRGEEERIKYLAAFVRLEGKRRAGAAEERRLQREIKSELRDRLPAYMLPKRIIFTEAMPVASGGKLDRKKLEESLK